MAANPDNALDLTNKTALITGGTTGIGRASALALHASGARVTVTGRNPDTLQQAREALPAEIDVVASDAADISAAKQLVTDVVDRRGGIDVLFLNAGIAHFVPTSDFDEALYDRLFAINVKGPFFTMQAALPHLNPGASVIVNTSVVWQKGMPGSGPYAATKAALRSYVRVWAAELAERGVRVNAVSPGPIETPIYAKMGMPPAQLDAFGQQIVSSVPLGRFGTPQEIAEAVRFLASPAASYINGVELAVDGGFTQV